MEALIGDYESFFLDHQRKLVEDPQNFIKITRMPKKIDPKALTSMIVSCSKILPKSTEIVLKETNMERVAFVEFKTPVEAFKAVDRLRMSPFCKTWNMQLTTKPKMCKPTTEVASQMRNK